MAIAVTNKIADANQAAAASWTSSTLTPSTDRLYLATVFTWNQPSSATPPLPTISGCGLTWVQVADRTVTFGSTFCFRITTFRAMKPSGLSSGALTVSFGGVSVNGGGNFIVDEVTGMDTSGTDGSAAIGQSAVGTGSGSSLSITLSSYPSADAAYGAMAFFGNISGISPEAGYTEKAECASSNLHCETEWKSGTDTTVTATASVNSGTPTSGGVALQLVRMPILGQAALTGSGSLTASGTRSLLGAADLSGVGSLAATGWRSRLGAAALTGLGSLAARGRIVYVQLHVEAAFGCGPWDTPTWTDITETVEQINWSYGRQNELNAMETGNAVVRIADENSSWDRANPDCFVGLKNKMPIRAYLDSGADLIPIFYGFLSNIGRSYRSTDQMTMRDLTLYDGMELLARAGVKGSSWSSEATHTRVGHILDAANVPAGSTFREIGTGSISVAAATFDDDDPTKALTHALAVADNEQGIFYWTPGGKYRFVGCAELHSDSDWNTPLYKFSDVTPGAGELPADTFEYEEIVIADDDVNVRNEWISTRAGGTPQVADDSASIDENGLRDEQIVSLATSDPVALWQAESRLAKFKDAMRRVDQVRVRPIVSIPDLTMIEAGFIPNVAQQIQANETPPGFASALEEPYVIQKVQGTIGKSLFFASVTWLLWPVADFVSPP